MQRERKSLVDPAALVGYLSTAAFVATRRLQEVSLSDFCPNQMQPVFRRQHLKRKAALSGEYLERRWMLNAAPEDVLLHVLEPSIPETIAVDSPVHLAMIEIVDDGVGDNRMSLEGEDSSFFLIDGEALYLAPNVSLDVTENTRLEAMVVVQDEQLGVSSRVSRSFSILVTEGVPEAPSYAVTHFLETSEHFFNSFSQGDSRGEIHYNAAEQTLRLTGPYDLGRFSFPARWTEFTFEVNISTLSFGNLILYMGSSASSHAFNLSGKVTADSIWKSVRISYDQDFRRLTAYVDGEAVGFASVVTPNWNSVFGSTFHSGGGYRASVVLRNVRIGLPVIDVAGPTGVFQQLPSPTVDAVSSVRITFSEPTLGVTVDDFTLVRDGEPVGWSGVSLSQSGTTFTLNGLAGYSGVPGRYEILFSDKLDVAVDVAGNRAVVEQVLFWEVSDFPGNIQTVPLASHEAFWTYYRQGDKRGTYYYDHERRSVSISGVHDFARFRMPHRWDEISFEINPWKLSFGQLDLRLSDGVRTHSLYMAAGIVEGGGWQKVKVIYDPVARALKGYVNDVLVREGTVLTDNWNRLADLTLNSGGGQGVGAAIRGLKVHWASPYVIDYDVLRSDLPEDVDTSGGVEIAVVKCPDGKEVLLQNDPYGAFRLVNRVDNAVTLILKEGFRLDFEETPHFDVEMALVDELNPGVVYDVASLQVKVVDVNEAPADLTLKNAEDWLSETTDTTSRQRIADISFTDDAIGQTVVSLTGADAAVFEVDANVLYLKAGTPLDFDVQRVYSVTVEVKDDTIAGSSTLSASHTLNIIAADEIVLEVAEGETFVESATYSGGTKLVKLGKGTLILDKANSHTGGMRVLAGTIVMKNAGAMNAGPLLIRGNAKVKLECGTTPVPLGSLTLGPNALFDLGEGGVTVPAGYYDESALRQALISGRNGGTWDGTKGIMSSTAAGVAGGAGTAAATTFAVGYKVNADSSVTVRHTANGDAQLDGKVDFDDILALFPNYNAAGSFTWQGGDFTYDGKVDFDDILALFPNYGSAGVFGTSGSGLGGGGGSGSSLSLGTGGGAGSGAGTGGGDGSGDSIADSRAVMGPDAPSGLARSTVQTLRRDDRGTTSGGQAGDLDATSLAFAGLVEQGGGAKKKDDTGFGVATIW